jgi:hypothetical protein
LAVQLQVTSGNKTMQFKLIASLVLMVHVSIWAASFYVSPPPQGNDSNAGTSAQPFATIQRAMTAVKNTDKSAAGSTVVTINGGTYTIAQPLVINDSAGGTPMHSVIYKATNGHTVLISGGKPVGGWSKTTGNPYYQASLLLDEVRDLYVNGERRTRARTNGRITGCGWVLSGTTRVGMYISKAKLPAIAHPQQLELHMQSDCSQ